MRSALIQSSPSQSRSASQSLFCELRLLIWHEFRLCFISSDSFSLFCVFLACAVRSRNAAIQGLRARLAYPCLSKVPVRVQRRSPERGCGAQLRTGDWSFGPLGLNLDSFGGILQMPIKALAQKLKRLITKPPVFRASVLGVFGKLPQLELGKQELAFLVFAWDTFPIQSRPASTSGAPLFRARVLGVFGKLPKLKLRKPEVQN